MTKVQEKELLGLGAKAEDIKDLSSADANKLIKELQSKVVVKSEYSLKGKYATLTKGKIHSPHLLRGSIDVAILLSKPEFYLRNEAKRYLKDAARNNGSATNIYPLLTAFGITEKSQIEKLAK